MRPQSKPVNEFRFGNQVITTKVNMMVPRTAAVQNIDVTASMNEEPVNPANILDNVFDEM